jgi:hypothetical protein
MTVRRWLTTVSLMAITLWLAQPLVPHAEMILLRASERLFGPDLDKQAADHALMARFYGQLVSENPNHKDVTYYREMAAYFDRTPKQFAHDAKVKRAWQSRQ